MYTKSILNKAKKKLSRNYIHIEIATITEEDKTFLKCWDK